MTDHSARHKSTEAAHKVAQVARDLEGGANNELDMMVAGLLFGVGAIILDPGLDRFLIQRDRDCDRRTARTVAALAHAEICLDNLDEQSAEEVAPVLARWVAGVNEGTGTP